MIRAAVHGVSMDLAMLRHSNAIHISIMAERAIMEDLRLMYRQLSDSICLLTSTRSSTSYQCPTALSRLNMLPGHWNIVLAASLTTP